MTPAVDVVVPAFGPEPLLGDCVAGVLASEGVDVQVHVVDNGAPAAVAGLAADPRVRVLRPPRNLGYAGGCNVGAADGTAGVVAFVNSDVIVEPGALLALSRRLEDPAVGLATGCLLLLEDRVEATRSGDLGGARVNTVGNPVHWTGFSWCGGFADPRRDHLEPGDVASVSGGLFAVRRETWSALRGFDDTFFAYHEDVDLSLRCWISDRSVVYEPAAVGWHDYAFARNPRKAVLVERNRLITWLTVPSAATWWRLALPFAVVQTMAFAKAVTAGDGAAWLRALAWTVSHPRTLTRRRREVQRSRQLPDAVWLRLVARRLEPPSPVGVAVPDSVNRVLETLSRLAIPRSGRT